jgi:membrane peptidoglycan carboxypeptidase
MAEGYAMFAARGMHCTSMAVLQVRDRDDAVIVDRKPTCNRVLDEGVADGVNDVLRGVIHNQGATGTRMRLDGGRVAAGKTGTTNNSIAVWFVGYTPQLSTAVAVADLDGEQESLDGRTYNGERIRSACGGCIAGPIWKKTMDAALEGTRLARFSKPNPKIVRGADERVPDVRGMTASLAADRLAEAGFTAHVAGEVASAIAQGLVVETDPTTGSNVASGDSIGLILSTGVATEPEKPDEPEPPGPPGNPQVPPPET